MHDKFYFKIKKYKNTKSQEKANTPLILLPKSGSLSFSVKGAHFYHTDNSTYIFQFYVTKPKNKFHAK